MAKKSEQKEAAGGAAKSASEPPPKKPRKFLYLLTGLLFGVALGGGGLYSSGLLGPAPGSEQAAINKAAQQMLDEAVRSAVAKLLNEGSEEVLEEPSAPVTQVLELDPFIVGLEGDGTATYARVGIGFGFNSDDPETPVIDPLILLPKVKDYLLSYMAGKTVRDMTGDSQRDQIKREVLDSVSAMIPAERGELVEVYLTEFLIQ